MAVRTLFGKGLTRSAILLLLLLDEMCRHSGGGWWSVKEVEDATGWSRPTIYSARKELVRARLIALYRHQAGGTVYEFRGDTSWRHRKKT